MAGVGIVLAWFGYSVMYYGIDLVTGGNEGFMTLVWPGRYQPVPRDQPGGGGSSGPPSGFTKPTTPAKGAQNAVNANPGLGFGTQWGYNIGQWVRSHL